MPARLLDLRWAGAFKRRAVEITADGKVEVFYASQFGQVFSTDDVTVQVIVETLAQAWPTSLPAGRLIEVVQKAGRPGQGDSEGERTQAALSYLLKNGLGRYSLDETPYDRVPPDSIAVIPSIFPVLASREKGKSLPLFNWLHEPIPSEVDGGLVDLHKLLDTLQGFGETKSELGALATRIALAPALTPEGHSLANQLEVLNRQGVFLAGAAGWRDYLHALLRASQGSANIWSLYVCALARYSVLEAGKSLATGVGQAHRKVAAELRSLAYTGKGGANLETKVRKLIDQSPRCDIAWDALGTLLRDKRDLSGALMAHLESLRLDAASAHRYALLALSLMQVAQFEAAEMCCLRSLALQPDYSTAHSALAVCYHKSLRYQESVFHFRRAIELDPSRLDSIGNYGVVLADMGDFIGAERQYVEVLSRNSSGAHFWGSRFFALNYFPERSAEDIFDVYKEFESKFCQPLQKYWKPHENLRSSLRKLRIGYVSPDFRQHPVALFLAPLMARHDASAFEIYAYSHVEREDAITEEFKGYASHWISTVAMSDSDLSRRIRDDKIDILIDLAGHTANNRLGVFARKPAPIQLTWLGFGYSTGLKAIDYILSDAEMAPKGTESLFSERPWRLAGSNFVYRPKPDMGEVGGLPALKNGYVRFVTLSRAIRLNDRVVRLWSDVLRRLPNAKLIVDSHSYHSTSLSEELISRFGSYGVKRERLEVGYRSPPWDLLRNADITLDCFPHNSGTTLFESLYMGVPFITLAGRLGVGRIGASTLAGLGRTEWIASSEADYVDKVVALASDIPALASVRAGLRAEMLASSLMDELAFAQKVEAAYRAMFKIWCDQA